MLVEVSADRGTGDSGKPLNLLAACANLYDLLLEQPDTEAFLRRIGELAVSVVPGVRCSLILHETEAETVADAALSVPGTEIPRQPSGDHHRGAEDAEPRITSDGVSLPLLVDGVVIATLDLHTDPSRPLRDADIVRVRTFGHQAAIALALLLRESAHLVLDDQLQDALVTRSVIDQAMGVLMHARRIPGREALRMLRRISQTTNRKVSELANEVIMTMTGHPPERPRPLARRRTTLNHHHQGEKTRSR